MERDKVITKATNEFIEKNELESFPNMLEDTLSNASLYMKEIMWAFEQLFQRGIEYQKESKKGEISFVVINFLHHSLLNGTFEFEIQLYDENFLADKKPISWRYEPLFLKKYYIDEWTSYEEYMKCNVIRITKNEKHPFRLILADKYKKIMESVFYQFTPFIMQLLSYENLIKSDTIKILYGDYYGKCVQLNE